MSVSFGRPIRFSFGAKRKVMSSAARRLMDITGCSQEDAMNALLVCVCVSLSRFLSLFLSCAHWFSPLFVCAILRNATEMSIWHWTTF